MNEITAVRSPSIMTDLKKKKELQAFIVPRDAGAVQSTLQSTRYFSVMSHTIAFDELETPALLVDLDRMERNLDRGAAYAREHGIALRPHIKTHKSPYLATMQLKRGAVGLTCATPYEAEVMGDVCDDLLVMYPPVG